MLDNPEDGSWQSGSMSAQELVLRQRTEILHALCSSRSSEILERVLDMLLARGTLVWEDYQNIQISGTALGTSARQLLDLVYTKGVEACGFLLAVLNHVLSEAQKAGLSFGAYSSDPELTEAPCGASATQTLLTERPGLVSKLRGCIDGALHVLVESGSFTSTDCDEVQLPIFTPSQQARHLLDHVRSKGEAAARVLLQYILQNQEHASHLNQETWTPTEDCFKYKKKLSSSVAVQSCFLSTYGGTSNMTLDDIYTESQLELAHDCADVLGSLSLEDLVGIVGTLNEDADTVLVSGEAGCGKSTLLQRLHLLWAQGAALQDFFLLFPFSCRRLNSEHRELSVQELLFHHCCWPDREQDQIFQFILDHPHLILFTFDGLDELKQNFSDEHRHCCPTQRAPVPILLFNLLQGSLMKGVRKVVTSRPEAVGPALKKYLRKEVHLKGFSPSGIDCFVRKHHSDPAVAARVLESLQTNTALLGLCHTPVLCWIVSQCHKELLGCGEGSPQTITDVYLMILQHFFQHQNPQKTLRIGWMQEHLNTALHLGLLAFKGIGNSCYIFSDTDLQTCGVTEEDICMGFLIHSKDISSNSCKRLEFLHVTMQCFFAALYIVLNSAMDRSAIAKLFGLQGMSQTGMSSTCFMACLPSTVQPELALEGEAIAVETANLQITATFVSGLLSQRYRGLLLHCCSSSTIDRKIRQVARCLSKRMQKHFKSISQPVEGEKKSMHAMPAFVWLIKCIYEMQESRLAQDIMSKLDVQHLKLTYCNIGPVECTALAYVLQHLKSPVGLQLDYNSVGDVGVEQLLPCMHVCNSLYLRNNNISDEGICKLIAKVIHCDNFQKIALFNNKLTDACTQHFSRLLKTKQNFLALRLGNNNITAEGAKQLAEGLQCNQSLQYLGLWGNKIGDTGAEALARALMGNKSLLWLSLVENGVGNAGACALADIVKNSTTLEELCLTKNYITRTGVECLIQALKHNTHVKSVWLKSNELSVEEVEEMTQRESRLIF
ncbi:nucleotide-binding oligomerization domain-containing protein 2 [Myripristis murdjan]|uniref:nucleotide-binding oligomerization domain-containing protein 2 n=1 Tax=Myripristis murdjan TaxID=586833 RepID=UPI00117636F7|nr:nucleotide-binding oligomerization domain-containing protein 2 [Myripristis murdjan]XP_029904439.1 nucleotide-binding oligomerization domain-containing protein 2 [Myripristis murdjan]XP_029904440.1 nucleotide-binding oligomerization domain-containing protein 2 [Myripristis murdjan]XP_029904442.1 nucleotide-binding oligomerization domain-containing protein 2 [Myripristis murdjan]XP_029904443.1 nucleotide-binding oligomerization domain-containing protein 2 [Myripristis murdjan]